MLRLRLRVRSVVVLLLLILSLISSTTASPTPPVKIVTNVVSALVKWVWSLKSTAKPGISSSRSMMKFESGYIVETVFDGSKMGIEPHSVQVSPNGQILVLDSENSNIYKITTPLSPNSRPKLVAGSFEGYSGHVDGKPREARLNHPKGLTSDDKGNIYVADTMNMAIRKISDTGVSTIAGGKWGRGGDHVDGPSEDAKFSNDFDVIYLASSCSLLVVDRGNQAIREIQLNDEDCSYDYDTSLNLGISMLLAATFFGYMLVLLQRRVRAMFSSQDNADLRNSTPPTRTRAMSMAPYRKSVRPPLIPLEENNYDYDRQEDGFLGSVGRLFVTTGCSVAQIFGRKRPRHQTQTQTQTQHQFRNYPNNTTTNYGWPTQESFMIPEGDEPPPIEARPQAKRPFLSKELEKNQVKQSRRGYYNCDYNGVHHLKKPPSTQQQLQNHQRQYSAAPSKTFYERSGEIVFGAVQEQASAVVIKAVDYADPSYNHHNIRPRVNYNYTGY